MYMGESHWSFSRVLRRRNSNRQNFLDFNSNGKEDLKTGFHWIFVKIICKSGST